MITWLKMRLGLGLGLGLGLLGLWLRLSGRNKRLFSDRTFLRSKNNFSRNTSRGVPRLAKTGM